MACNLSLPLRVENPQFRVGRIGAVEDPARDLLVNSSRQYYWTNPGVAIFNDRGGVGICAIDSPLVSLGEAGIMRFDGQYVPTKSRVYFNMQNNVWHTNFCDWWSGPMCSRFRLWTFDRYSNSAALVIPGMNAKRPLLAAVAEGPAGKLSQTQCGVSVAPGGIDHGVWRESRRARDAVACVGPGRRIRTCDHHVPAGNERHPRCPVNSAVRNQAKRLLLRRRSSR